MNWDDDFLCVTGDHFSEMRLLVEGAIIMFAVHGQRIGRDIATVSEWVHFLYAVFQQDFISGMATKEDCKNHSYSRVHLPFCISSSQVTFSSQGIIWIC